MTSVTDFCEYLDSFAPPHLAEEWDNVGLLVGDPERMAQRVMTCLTITGASVAEAVQQQADLIVSHHPLPFRPLPRLTTSSTPGRLLLELVEARIAVYSPHTAFDSARQGINRQLAEGLGLTDIRPLTPARSAEPGGAESAAGEPLGAEALGAGRFGVLPEWATLGELAERLKSFLQISGLHVVGSADQRVMRIAVACGSAGEFLPLAREKRCELLVTGETSFHTCLEAEATGVALLLPGHYASERFAVERLAEVLAARFPEQRVWASRNEADPLSWR